MARKLLIIPIFHTGAEMGTAREGLEKISERLVGIEVWNRHKKNLLEFWDLVEKLVLERTKDIDISKVKLYQDGQVINGAVGVKMVEEIAKRGSKNHQILLNLINRGAKLMRTESFELLKEEYRYIRGIVLGKSLREVLDARIAYKKRKDLLLKERDKYIAKNISKSLGENELGILFIGAMHKVEQELPKDVEIEYLEDARLKILMQEIMKVIAKTILI
ncbi:MAG: hypothetical protein AB1485_00425 [Candidatus Thermoplasmatota archaeon]